MAGKRGLGRVWAVVSGWRWVRKGRVTLERYGERHGDHYAAAVTFFTLLSMVPLLMIGLSVAGFVLAGDQALVARIDELLADTLPTAVSDQLSEIVLLVVDERGRLGVLALIACVYSGWSWISNLRDAVTALLGQRGDRGPVVRTALADIGTLVGVGLALVVSVGLAALTGTAGGWLLSWTGLDRLPGASVVLLAGSLLLGLVANCLIVAWCLARLPRTPRPFTSGLRAAAVATLGLAVLQQAGGLYLSLLGRTPAVATLGALVGLLLFVYLIVRWLLLVTVWTSVADVDTGTPTATRAAQAGSTLAAGASVGVVLRGLSGR